MTAELRDLDSGLFVVDVECGIEEDWGADRIGAGVRLDEHNERVHPLVAAGATEVEPAL